MNGIRDLHIFNHEPEVLEVPLARWRLDQGQWSLRSSPPMSWASWNLYLHFSLYLINMKSTQDLSLIVLVWEFHWPQSTSSGDRHLVRWKRYYRLLSAHQTDTERRRRFAQWELRRRSQEHILHQAIRHGVFVFDKKWTCFANKSTS